MSILTTPQICPPLAPAFGLHRENVLAADASVPDVSLKGINFADRMTGVFQVVPSGGAEPSVEVFFWSEAAGTFVASGITKNAPGANTPFEFTFEAAGRIAWLKVTQQDAGSTDIYVSSFDQFPRT